MENIVAGVTFQFWAIFFINFGQFFAILGNFLTFFLPFFAIFGHFNIIVQGYLSKHIFHTLGNLSKSIIAAAD